MYTKFHLDWLLAIVMYGLRLFIVVLQELQCLPNCLHTYVVKVKHSADEDVLKSALCMATKLHAGASYR